MPLLSGVARTALLIIVTFTEVPQPNLVEVMQTQRAGNRILQRETGCRLGQDVGHVQFEEVDATKYVCPPRISYFDLHNQSTTRHSLGCGGKQTYQDEKDECHKVTKAGYEDSISACFGRLLRVVFAIGIGTVLDFLGTRRCCNRTPLAKDWEPHWVSLLRPLLLYCRSARRL